MCFEQILSKQVKNTAFLDKNSSLELGMYLDRQELIQAITENYDISIRKDAKRLF